MKSFILILISVSFGFAIDTALAVKKNLEISSEYVGNIYSKEQRSISTRIMGYIKSIKVEEGDFVNRGDLLFEVDPSDIESAISQANANVTKAKSGVLMAKLDLQDAKRDYERYKNLYEKEVVPKRDYEKMKLKLELKRSGVNLAKSIEKQALAELGRAKAQVKYAKVTSSFDGVVIAKHKNTSELTRAGEPVLTISSLSGIRAKALIQESDIKNFKIEQVVNIEIPALSKVTDGKIVSIVPSADLQTHTYIAKFSLNNRENLTPGMYAKIKIGSDSKEAIVVPLSSVTNRSGIGGVFVVENGKAIFKKIEILSKHSSVVEVNGLNEGDRVILYPKRNLKDGASVEDGK